jgi:hypothetical protein
MPQWLLQEDSGPPPTELTNQPTTTTTFLPRWKACLRVLLDFLRPIALDVPAGQSSRSMTTFWCLLESFQGRRRYVCHTARNPNSRMNSPTWTGLDKRIAMPRPFLHVTPLQPPLGGAQETAQLVEVQTRCITRILQDIHY